MKRFPHFIRRRPASAVPPVDVAKVTGWMGPPGREAVTAVAMGFMLLLAAINLRGVGEGVKFNVVLTLVEVTALCIVIGIG